MIPWDEIPLSIICTNLTGDIVYTNNNFKAKFEFNESNKNISEFFSIPFDKLLDSINNQSPLKLRINNDNFIILNKKNLNDILWIIISEDISYNLYSPEGQIMPSNFQILQGFYLVSNQLNLLMREEELVNIFLSLINNLFPSRLLCFKLIFPFNYELSFLYANGLLKDKNRDKLVIDKNTVELMGDKNLLDNIHNKLIVTDKYEPIFEEGKMGFCLPLSELDKCFGFLHVEYKEEYEFLPKQDIEIFKYLSAYITTSLKNSRILKESLYLKDYLEKVLEYAYLPIIVTDNQFRVEVVNLSWEKISGISKNLQIGKELFNVLPQELSAKLKLSFYKALKGELSKGIEVRIPTNNKDKSIRISFTVAPIQMANHDIEGVIAIGHDLTEIRELQKQVIQYEKLATIGQLAAGIAHELNNPLTFISIYSEYLIKKYKGRDKIDNSDIEKMERISEGAERILKFTRDLVYYARPAGEEPTLVNIEMLIDKSIVFCEHMIKKYNAKIVKKVDENVSKVYGIQGQLEQVLVNLITNSCQAMPKENGYIVIEAKNINNETVQIIVEDNGCGILPEDKDKVFEPFFTTKSEGEGTGLGLSIVKNIIENHNAKIYLKSEDGKGTQFFIELYAEE